MAVCDFAKQRERMVREQIHALGVRNERVLEAMRKVCCEVFDPQDVRELAYSDMPLPIAEGQTISQPYIVAFMIEALALQGGEKLLALRKTSLPTLLHSLRVIPMPSLSPRLVAQG